MRALLFDVGGTLLREDGYDLAAAIRAALEPRAVRAAAIAAEAWPAELARWLDEVRERGHEGRSLQRWLAERLRAPETIDRDALEDRMWRAGVRMSALPGAREALAAAAERGLALAALSNTVFSARRMRLALEEAGLAAPLDFVLSSAELPHAKPHPAPFRTALERLGVAAADAAYVGDSWENDVEGAHAAGLQPIWIAPEPRAGSRVPHRRIATIALLPALLGGAP